MAGSGAAVVAFAAFGVASQAVLVCFFIARRCGSPPQNASAGLRLPLLGSDCCLDCGF